MTIKTLIKHSEYHDSVTLMLVARELAQLDGVTDAAVVMGTEANKSILRNSDMLTPEAETASPNDLVIAISAPEDVATSALAAAENFLQKKQTSSDPAEYKPRSLNSAWKSHPEANVAVISVAGRYAAAEAWDALARGMHVLLFSDNVSLEDEIALKKYAVEHNLLLMGPGAGTAILNGVALGFANVIPPGPVGIVSAAGTGLQEVSTLLARYGTGITQGIGTGGRDLKEEVGGLMMMAGLQALQDDPQTRVLCLVSKPPSAGIAGKILTQAACSDKPTVACLLGLRETPDLPANVHVTRTLEEAAQLSARLATGNLQDTAGQAEAKVDASLLAESQRNLRALFSGGTLCYEGQVIWRDLLNRPVLSNAPLEPSNQLPDSTRSKGHTAVDLGEEEFTVGRPHPMIDNDLRVRRLMQEARDPETAVIVLDVVLGYGAHPDPASELGPAIRQARDAAAENGRTLFVVASVTGTEYDPQGLTRQTRALEEAGAVMCASNAAAARLAAKVVA